MGSGLLRFDQLTELQQVTVQTALEAASRAYAPYSKFPVGAAVATSDGVVASGCNVENASYGLSMCAERVAVGNLYASCTSSWTARGRTDLVRIVCVAVCAPRVRGVQGDSVGVCYPCGACRQVLAEHAAPEAELVLVSLHTNTWEDVADASASGAQRCRYLVSSLEALLPCSFRKEQLPIGDSKSAPPAPDNT
jgi:cytidine deaminase